MQIKRTGIHNEVRTVVKNNFAFCPQSWGHLFDNNYLENNVISQALLIKLKGNARLLDFEQEDGEFIVPSYNTGDLAMLILHEKCGQKNN